MGNRSIFVVIPLQEIKRSAKLIRHWCLRLPDKLQARHFVRACPFTSVIAEGTSWDSLGFASAARRYTGSGPSLRQSAATTRQWRAFLAAVPLVFLIAGCRHPVDGRRVLLQSEVAVDKVLSFRAHIKSYGIGTVITDAQYDCDRFVSHYIETDERLNRKIEYIQTQWYVFSRSVQDNPGKWNAVFHAPNEGPCQRIHAGGGAEGQSRLFSADQGRILPPFFYYANEFGTVVITPMGNEAIDGVYCEIWKVSDNGLAPLHSIWIAAEDRLPRKYVEGELDNPQGIVTYSDYGAHFDIDVPPDPFVR
jgi:hypothetical protein